MALDVYQKLAKHLDGLPGGFPPTEDGVELKILHKLFTPEQAVLAVHCTLIPEEARVIARRAGLSVEVTEREKRWPFVFLWPKLFVVLREPGSGMAGAGSKGVALDGQAAGAAAAANAALRMGAFSAEAADTGVPVELKKALLDAIRTKLSSRHVPNDVFAIPEVPRTISGKKMEVPVKKILLGQPVAQSVNVDSMANPQSIDWFVGFAREHGGEARIVFAVVVAHEEFIGTRAAAYAAMAIKTYFRSHFAASPPGGPAS
jgi:hypothetical protein